MRNVAATGIVISLPFCVIRYCATGKLPLLQFAWMAVCVGMLCVAMILSTSRTPKR